MIQIEQGGIRGWYHAAEAPAKGALALTHGAGGRAEMPLLVAVAEALSSAGIAVLRFDLPFRQSRPSGPPHPSWAAKDQAGIRDAVAWLKTRGAERVFAGGQSYGGRQATLLASASPGLVDGLLLLAYPLHPPGKPENLRTAHFPALQAPCLFVHGSADAFATNDELDGAVKTIGAAVRVVHLEGLGHDLRRGKFDLRANVVEPFLALAGK